VTVPETLAERDDTVDVVRRVAMINQQVRRACCCHVPRVVKATPGLPTTLLCADGH
jgi:hypothetical protein